MQFLLTGFDGHDESAPQRRSAAREAHLARVAELAESGQFVYGGALLDDSETLIGSVLILEFPDRAALQNWLADEPYVIEEVWQSVNVTRCRPAPIGASSTRT